MRGEINSYDTELVSLNLPFSEFHLTTGTMGTLRHYMRACRIRSGPHAEVPYAAIFAQWGKEVWASNIVEFFLEDTIKVTLSELAKLPKMPAKLKTFKRPTHHYMTDEENATQKERNDWVATVSKGVCSECMWRRFAGTTLSVEVPRGLAPRLAMEWIYTVHLLRDECREQGKRFMDFEIKGVDEQWKN